MSCYFGVDFNIKKTKSLKYRHHIQVTNWVAFITCSIYSPMNDIILYDGNWQTSKYHEVLLKGSMLGRTPSTGDIWHSTLFYWSKLVGMPYVQSIFLSVGHLTLINMSSHIKKICRLTEDYACPRFILCDCHQWSKNIRMGKVFEHFESMGNLKLKMSAFLTLNSFKLKTLYGIEPSNTSLVVCRKLNTHLSTPAPNVNMFGFTWNSFIDFNLNTDCTV